MGRSCLARQSRSFIIGETNFMSFIELLQSMGKIFVEYWDIFLIKGLGITLLLSIITVAFGSLIGALFAMAKISRLCVLKFIVSVIVEIIRGTPILLQLYVAYFLIPMLFPALKLSDFACIAIALVLNSAAYVSEIIRSGIEAVDKGQTEASRSLGLSASVTMIHIVIPQAIKNILPALGNEFITVIKETSLASTFFVGELMTSYLIVKGNTFSSLPTLMIVGVIYFVLTFILSKILKVFERRMKSHA